MQIFIKQIALETKILKELIFWRYDLLSKTFDTPMPLYPKAFLSCSIVVMIVFHDIKRLENKIPNR